MSMQTMNRRVFLECGIIGGTVAAAAFSSGTRVIAAGSAFDPSQNIGPGDKLVVWVLVRPEQRAELRTVHWTDRGEPAAVWPAMVFEARELAKAGTPVSAWGQAQEACIRAKELARTIAARSWGIAPEQCEFRGRLIVHPPTERSVPHLVWVDFA